MIDTSSNDRTWNTAGLIGLTALILIAGVASASMLPLAMLLIGVTLVVFATRYVDRLVVAMFWTLPYMIASIPTGSFTLKLPEFTAYVFGLAAVLRAVIRRERWSAPPATATAIILLAVMLISTAWEPAAPIPFLGAIKPTDRNSPALRSMSDVIWMTLSWIVVVATYNVIGRRRELFRKCVVAHCLSGGLASIISLCLFIPSFFGFHLRTIAGAGRMKDAATAAGDFFRLAGVAYEPLVMAFFLLSVIPVTAVVYLLRPNWLPRKIAGICLTFQAIALVLTFSAGGLCGMVVILVVLWKQLRHAPIPRYITRRLAMTGAAFAAVCVIGSVAVASVTPVVGKMLTKITNATSSSRRTEWIAGFSEFEDYPLLGVGPGMSNYHFPQYNPELQSQSLSGGLYEVNNIILGTLGETGILGLIALLACTASGLRALVQRITRFGSNRVPVLTALTASLIGCGIQAQSIGLNILTLIYFTGLLALAVSAVRVEHLLPEEAAE